MAEAYTPDIAKREAEILFQATRVTGEADDIVPYWTDVLQASYVFMRGDVSPEGLLGEVSLIAGGPYADLHSGVRPFAERVASMKVRQWRPVLYQTLEFAKAARSQRNAKPEQARALVVALENQGDHVANIMMGPLGSRSSRSYARTTIGHVLKHAFVFGAEQNLKRFETSGLVQEGVHSSTTEGALGAALQVHSNNINTRSGDDSAFELSTSVAENWHPENMVS